MTYGLNSSFKRQLNNKSKNKRLLAVIILVLIIVFSIILTEREGEAIPEEAVKNTISATKDGDFKKLVNNFYFESDEARTKFLAELKSLNDNDKIELVNKFSEVEIGEVKSINENRAKVELKAKGNDLLKQLGGDTTRTIYVKKVNGRWFVEVDELIRQD